MRPPVFFHTSFMFFFADEQDSHSENDGVSNFSHLPHSSPDDDCSFQSGRGC